MLNDIKTPPIDPVDPPAVPPAVPSAVPSMRSSETQPVSLAASAPDRVAAINAAIIPGVAGPSPSIRPDEVTRAVDPTAPDSGHVPRNPLVQPHAPIRPHADPSEPGLHKTRVMGEPTHIDPEYAMPMEDRGSFFSLTLSAVVVGVVFLLLLIVWWSFFKTAG